MGEHTPPSYCAGMSTINLSDSFLGSRLQKNILQRNGSHFYPPRGAGVAQNYGGYTGRALKRHKSAKECRVLAARFLLDDEHIRLSCFCTPL